MNEAPPEMSSQPDGPLTAPRPVFVGPRAGDPDAALRRQQAAVAVGRRAIAPSDLLILLQDSAAMVADMLGVPHSGIAQPVPEGDGLELALALGSPGRGEPRRAAERLPSAPEESLAGYCLEVAHPVLVSDLHEEPRLSDKALRKHGIRGGLAVPLKLHDRTFGVLLALDVGAREFLQEDVLFAENIAHMLTTCIARQKAEEMLVRERNFAAGLLQTVGALVLVLDPAGKIVRVNRACEDVTGFQLDEIRGRPIWNVFPVPAEADLFQVIFSQLKGGAPQVEYESLLMTKHGRRRRITWAYSAMRSVDGSLERVIATGIDVTEQRAAEEELRQVKEDLEAVRAVGQATAEGPSPDGQPEAVAWAGPVGGLNSERRRHVRRSYPYRQPIAYVLDGRLPAPDQFHSVQCNDIAANGFSFLSRTPPQSDCLVVALGTPPRVTYVAAQIVHATRVEQNGQKLFLVGCCYTNRVRY